MRSLIKLGLASLFKKDENNGISIIAFLCVFISLPIIFLVALFSGGSSDAADPYEVAYSSTLCHPDYKYQLDDVRFFDSYTRKENDELKSDDILERLRNDYFIFRKSDSGKQVCILKPDEEIWDTLETKYHVKKKYKDEILETVLQLRNDRQNFETPISDYKILTNYEPSKKQEGITLSVEKDSSIRAIADGKIVEIKNSSSTYKTEIDGEEIEKKEGLTVTIEHEVQQGLKENGDYKFIKMYTRYTNLKKVPWQLDQEIKQGKEIGISDKEYFHFQLMDKDKKAMDPNEYILFMSDDFEMPLEKPFSVTSPFGEREFDGFHYGIDISKKYDAPIFAITSGEVVETNSTCGPNSGPTMCPDNGILQGGGNYVVIKTTIEGTEYYIQYLHMVRPKVSAKQKIYPGQLIGYQGNSGNSYGSHVHIEIHKDGINSLDKATVVDPNEWLKLDIPKDEK